MLFYMHQLMAQGRAGFQDALHNHADIYRKTSFYHLEDPSMTSKLKPEWDRCTEHLAGLFRKSVERSKPSSETEDEGFEILKPYLEQRIKRALPIVDYRQSTSFGCFFYESEKSVLDLHFINSVMPDSPFENILDRAKELSKLLHHCSEVSPELRTIKFGSWLNDYPPYRQLFPTSWHDSGERKKYNSFAWWGQFMNRKGDIHSANATNFRETGIFPYRCTFHECTIRELQLHLGMIMESNKRYV